MNRIPFFFAAIFAIAATLPDAASAQTEKQWDYPPGGCPAGGALLEPFRTDTGTPDYYFPAQPAIDGRPEMPEAFTVWRAPCGFNLGTSELRLRVTAQPGKTGFRPRIAIVQDGVEHGCNGPNYSGDPDKPYIDECKGATGFYKPSAYVTYVCPPFYVNCVTPEKYHEYMTRLFSREPVTLSLDKRVTTFDPDRAFTLRVRGNWPASVPDVVYEIPAKNVAGNAAIIPKYIAGQWWNPKEPGWGLILDRNERGAVFAAWLTYDDKGDTTWYVMTNSKAEEEAWAVSGNVYALRGQPFSMPAVESAFGGEIVGRFRVSFVPPQQGEAAFSWSPIRVPATRGEFSYVINGRSGSSPIERLQVRNPAGQLCIGDEESKVLQVDGLMGWAAQLEGSVDIGGPANCTVHGTLMTYDDKGMPMWVFGPLQPNPIRPGGSSFGLPLFGALYRPRGTPYGLPYEAGRLNIGPPVGIWEGTQSYPKNVLQQVKVTVNGTQRILDFQKFTFEY